MSPSIDDAREMARRMRDEQRRASERGVPDPYEWLFENGVLLASRAAGPGDGPMLACVGGSRLYVAQVADMVERNEGSVAAVLESDTRLSEAQVGACLDYAAEHPQQMEQDRLALRPPEERR